MPKKPNAFSAQKAGELYRAVLSLRTADECRRFFRDLCTIEELADMADRWQIVRLVARGVPYRSIAQKLSVSSTTVARVAQWLYNGEGGYQLVAKRLGVTK
ncbi:MAG: YerC/YecD family TrpR-related protein [Patescibacteria group bacterium]